MSLLTLASKNPAVALGVVAISGLAIWLLMRGFGGVAKDAAKATVNVATGAVAGVAVGVGAAVGLPETDLDQCELDIKNGDYWGASVHCSAGRFLRYSATGK